MGCKSSICTDANELLLSQHLHDKEVDVTIPVSEKSTNHSLNSGLSRNTKSLDPNRSSFLLKTFSMLMLKSFENNEELIQISDLWISEIYKSLEDTVSLPEDLRTIVSIDSSGKNIFIKHEIDGLRSYEKIAWFCQKLQSICKDLKIEKFKYKNFIKSEEFLMSLGPLTISVYIRLGNEIDCGIGIEKPLDRKQMSQFLSLSSEAKNIATWCNNNGQPIPIACSFSTLSAKKCINFYIFDGLKEQNFTRGLSSFYYFGAPVPENLQNLMKESKTEELNCYLEFDNNCISSVSIMTQALDSGNMLKELDTPVDEKMWTQFQNFFTVKSISLDLTSDGFTFRQHAYI